MASLFISYSRKDIDFAQRLTEAFKGQDLDFWIDWEDIPPTVEWWREIEKGIEEADIFLFLLSPDSVTSQVCKQEIEHAAKNGKRLIPIVVGDINTEDSPPELGHLNWIFFRENDDFDQSFRKLITAIKTDYEWVQNHRRLQVRALEWDRGNRDNSFLLRGTDLQDAEAQLVANAGKNPNPTDLQTKYVLKSRQASDRQRRITTGIAIVGVIALSALAVFGFVQANLATDNATEAQNQAATAQSASTLAVANEATAQANAEEARRQAEISFARQLAAQAQSIFGRNDSQQQTAVLLAVLSAKTFPIYDALQVLQTNTLTVSRTIMDHDTRITSVAISPNERYVASGSDGNVKVWETSTGEEVIHIKHDGWVTALAFSPNEKHLISGSDGNAKVWEVSTGEEVAHLSSNGVESIIAFSQNDRYIALKNDDETIRVWDTNSKEEVGRIPHSGHVFYFAISPSGEYVTTDSCVWKTANAEEISCRSNELYVVTASFSQDSRYIVTGSQEENAVQVWETETGEEIAYMRHDGWVTDVAFSPNGEYVVSGSGDRTARVWEIATEAELARMTHDNWVRSVAFSPNGEYVFSLSDDGTARIWKTADGEEVARITHVNSVALSSNGKYAVSGSDDGTIHVWEPSTRREAAGFPHSKRLLHFAVSPNRDFLVWGEGDDKVTTSIWEINSKEEVASITHDYWVYAVVFSPTGKHIVSLEANATARVWETTTGKEISHIPYEGRVTDITFSPNDKYLISRSNGNILIWETATGEVLPNINHNGITAVDFSPDSKYVVSGSSDGNIQVWEIATGEEVAQMNHDGAISSIDFGPDGKYVISRSGNVVRIWNTTTGEELDLINYIGGESSIVFSPDTEYVISGSDDGIVRVWDIATGKIVSQMVHNGAISSLVISSDGKFVGALGPAYGDYLASMTDPVSIRIWEVSTQEEVARVTYESGMSTVDFSPDENYIISVGCDFFDSNSSECAQGTVHVWDTTTGRETARMTHDSAVNSIAFSPDEKYIASGDSDGNARVWEVETGSEFARITHDEPVISVNFSSNGKYVVSGACAIRSCDRVSLYAWSWQPDDLIMDACSRTTRNLSREEWNRYIGDALPYQAVCDNLPIESEAIPSTQ